MSTKRLNAEEFIRRSKEKYGENRCDYRDVIYINSTTEVKLHCNTLGHKEFYITPKVHLHLGYGCEDCNKTAKINLNKFLIRAIEIHGLTYNYSRVIIDENTNQKSKVEIGCEIHGWFWQTIHEHIGVDKCGCPDCGRESMRKYFSIGTQGFIDRAIKKFGNKFDYSEVNYINQYVKVPIGCPSHGKKLQTPKAHLNSVHGCAECAEESFVSQEEIEWLDILSIPKEFRNKKPPHLDSSCKYRADGYSIHTMTIFEFDGDYYHGNPDVFNHEKINLVANKTFGKLYEKTIKRKNYFASKGYTVISIWQKDYRKYKKDISSGKCKPEDILNYCQIIKNISE